MSSNKLEQMVKENEENLETGQFDLIVQKDVGVDGYLSDPWLIAITAILAAILLLVLLAAVRQCFKG